jgi:hypothetical protein
MVTAYLRERFRLQLFAPLACAIALGASGGRLGWDTVVVDAGFALLLLAQFRLWDDLADRTRDAVDHPDRVLVRAREVTPAIAFCGALAVLNICIAVWRSGTAVAVLGGLDLAAGAWYLSAGSKDPADVRTDPANVLILLAKYPAFVFIVAGGRTVEMPMPVFASAVAVYGVVCAYEAWHDPLNWRSVTWR